jgi:hypothetical protein
LAYILMHMNLPCYPRAAHVVKFWSDTTISFV